jgi:hypothetical protein
MNGARRRPLPARGRRRAFVGTSTSVEAIVDERSKEEAASSKLN